MLLTLKTILEIAESRRNGIGAFNVCSLEGIRAVIAAAEQLKQPVIMQYCNSLHKNVTPLNEIGPIMLELADKSTVPVCVHLDHGETLEEIAQALRLGFTGIMYDGSALPYEENIANTRAVVEMATAYGVSVEAEIGYMGRESCDSSQVPDGSNYTKPDEAAEFAEATGIDALACSFGTMHGIYCQKPKLDLERLGAIRRMTELPIVMHGGSGISDEEFVKCIDKGVRKINFYTYSAKYAAEYIYEKLNVSEGNVYFHDIVTWATASMERTYIEAIKTFSRCY